MDRDASRRHGKALTLCREQIGGPSLSRNEMARRIRRAAGYISEVERGIKSPSGDVKARYEQELGLRAGAIDEVAQLLAEGIAPEEIDPRRFRARSTPDDDAATSIARVFVKINDMYDDRTRYEVRMEARALKPNGRVGIGAVGEAFAKGGSFGSQRLYFVEPFRADIITYDEDLPAADSVMSATFTAAGPKQGNLLLFRPAWTRIELLQFDMDAIGVFWQDIYEVSKFQGPLANLVTRVVYGSTRDSAFDTQQWPKEMADFGSGEPEEVYAPLEYHDLQIEQVYGIIWERKRRDRDTYDGDDSRHKPIPVAAAEPEADDARGAAVSEVDSEEPE